MTAKMKTEERLTFRRRDNNFHCDCVSRDNMNVKILFKTLFLILMLVLFVIMGMHNQAQVSLYLPPLISDGLKQPAAIMYIGFFGLGLLTGTILAYGGKAKGKSKGD
jgi:uncharacterized integral membrane protein